MVRRAIMGTPNIDAGQGGDAGPGARRFQSGMVGRLLDDRMTLFFCLIILLIVLSAIFAPVLAPYSPDVGSVARRLKPIGYQGHWLGTDEQGRDMLSRLLYGGRISLLMGLVPIVFATMVGGGLGIVAGCAGGTVNTVIMRAMDVFYAFPSVLLSVAISGMLGGGLVNGLLALTLVFIPPMCRVAETATAQVCGLDFVDAARASGAGVLSIIRTHIVINVAGPMLVYASSLVSISVLLAAGLSFLGFGVEPPTADWGSMLASLRQAIYVDPALCVLPGAAIFIASLSFNLMSDGLRQAMDAKS